MPTRQVVALANIAQTKRVVFQVAYDERLREERANLLERRGYEVVSVVGNERSKAVLGLPQRVDLFIVGHDAPEPTRTEIVVWLKTKYPKVPVVALNLPGQELPSADYNALVNDPETWLPIVNSRSRLTVPSAVERKRPGAKPGHVLGFPKLGDFRKP